MFALHIFTILLMLRVLKQISKLIQNSNFEFRNNSKFEILVVEESD